jgi:hypothetical protein
MAKSAAERSAEYRAKDVEAYRAKKAAYARTPEQRAIRTEYMRKYRDENREAFNAMCNASHKRHRVKNKDSVRNDHYKRNYGITLDDFNKMAEQQGHKCKICETTEPKGMGAWHVDHCHETKKVRGLLCNNCNTKLGWYERCRQQIEEYLNG